LLEPAYPLLKQGKQQHFVVSISGRASPGPGFYSPTITNNASDRAVASTNTNSLTFSGFTGNATLADDASDGFDNLVQTNGTTLVSGGTLNWALGSGASGARPAAETNWYVTIPTASAQTITYVADFGTGRNAADNLTIYTSAGNETTGFSFDIVLIPEPSAAVANRALLQAPCVSNHWRYRVFFVGWQAPERGARLGRRLVPHSRSAFGLEP